MPLGRVSPKMLDPGERKGTGRTSKLAGCISARTSDAELPSEPTVRVALLVVDFTVAALEKGKTTPSIIANFPVVSYNSRLLVIVAIVTPPRSCLLPLALSL